jgi:hypothetical protein
MVWVQEGGITAGCWACAGPAGTPGGHQGTAGNGACWQRGHPSTFGGWIWPRSWSLRPGTTPEAVQPPTLSCCILLPSASSPMATTHEPSSVSSTATS